MTFPILGGNGAVATYQIDNSLRFNDNDSPVLTRTPASAGNRQTWTVSFWIKRANLSTNQGIFSTFNGTASINTQLSFTTGDVLNFYDNDGSYQWNLITNQVFRDVSSWYHIVLAVDTTQATSSNRLKMYVNGEQITSFSTETYPSLNHSGADWNNSVYHSIGKHSTNYYDGYLAEFHNIDGQALSPTDFGEFSEEGIWKPISYSGSYGTNGFKLDFSDSGSLGADSSPNSNSFTPSNLSATDQTTDTPTNNFATLNALVKSPSSSTLSEGNLKTTTTITGTFGGMSTLGVSQGKWYAEFKYITDSPQNRGNVAITRDLNPYQNSNTSFGNNTKSLSYRAVDGKTRTNSTNSSYGSTWTQDDIIGVALDLDNGYVYFSKNGVWQNSGDPESGASGTGGLSDSISIGEFHFIGCGDDTGSESEVLGANFGNPFYTISSGNSDDNGYGNFEYAPPSGYLALCTQNLATELSPTIDDGSEYFNTVLYTGNGGTQSITGVGFQSDWTWIKRRNTLGSPALMDSSRGEDNFLESSGTAAEVTFASSNFTFTSDGYDLDYTGGYNNINQSGTTYAGWNWLANGGTTSSNTDGTITSTVQANTTAGFSIVTFTGTTSNQSVGHGLNQAPEIFFAKSRVSSANWNTYTSVIDGSLDFLFLNSTNASGNASNSLPTSSVIYQNQTDSSVAYCFHSVEGYSKIGKYTGNGSTDGTFVYTGFRPQWIMWKRTDSTADWEILDDKINPHNEMFTTLEANTSDAEGTEANGVDMLSNGFKHRNSFNSNNASSGTYIYMAFAENPFVSSTGIPVTAR